jgi:hypothetical protein
MAPGRGRPPKPTAIDGELMTAVRKALLHVARDVSVPTRRYPAASVDAPSRTRTEPQALDLAVLAVQAEAALEIIAAEQVAKAREHDQLTWEQVGEGFGTSAQSAHIRFGRTRAAAATTEPARRSR